MEGFDYSSYDPEAVFETFPEVAKCILETFREEKFHIVGAEKDLFIE